MLSHTFVQMFSCTFGWTFARSSPEQAAADIMPEWMTYAQGGERFGMSSDAFRMRSRRLGWRIQPGNDGRALVQIPDNAEMQPRERSGERSGEHSIEHSPEQEIEIARLTALLGAAEQRAEQAEQRAATADTDRRAAIALADHTVGLLTDVVARADRAEKALADQQARIVRMDQELGAARSDASSVRQQGEVLREQMETLHRDLATAEAVAAESHASLDAAHRQAREAQVAAEAAQLAQVEAETGAANLRTDIEAAQRLVEAAQERAEALTKAEVDRKGRGRWARLRAAWRGE